MVAAAIVGFITGGLCVVLKLLISLISLSVDIPAEKGLHWQLLVLPLIGLVLANVFSRFLLKTRLSRGTEHLIGFLRSGGYGMSCKYLFGPIIANSFTLGFGGSGGAESPIAVTGAAVGSRLGLLLGLKPEHVRMLIGCGAGAGIAAIFKAPVGGLLFTLEILRLPYNTFTFLTLLLSCVASSLTCFILTGFTFDVYLQHTVQFEPRFYLGVMVFGILSGVYSIYYSSISRLSGRLYTKIRNVYMRVSLAGICLGIIIMILPAFYGEGYGVMDRMLNGDLGALSASGSFAGAVEWELVAVVGALLILKCVVVGITTYVGVAGDFAPALFAGSLAGMLFAMVVNMTGLAILPVSDFALIGMCAVFSGVIRAPFMAMFLTAEMTGNFTLFLPMVLASALSYGVMRLITDKNYYHESVTPAGIDTDN